MVFERGFRACGKALTWNEIDFSVHGNASRQLDGQLIRLVGHVHEAYLLDGIVAFCKQEERSIVRGFHRIQFSTHSHPSDRLALKSNLWKRREHSIPRWSAKQLKISFCSHSFLVVVENFGGQMTSQLIVPLSERTVFVESSPTRFNLISFSQSIFIQTKARKKN